MHVVFLPYIGAKASKQIQVSDNSTNMTTQQTPLVTKNLTGKLIPLCAYLRALVQWVVLMLFNENESYIQYKKWYQVKGKVDPQ